MYHIYAIGSSVQSSSVAQLCPTLCDPMDCSNGFGNGFFDMTLKAQVTKEKTDKLGYIRIKNFCT